MIFYRLKHGHWLCKKCSRRKKLFFYVTYLKLWPFKNHIFFSIAPQNAGGVFVIYFFLTKWYNLITFTKYLVDKLWSYLTGNLWVKFSWDNRCTSKCWFLHHKMLVHHIPFFRLFFFNMPKMVSCPCRGCNYVDYYLSRTL